jgi:DNA-binding NtrC family response regulator
VLLLGESGVGKELVAAGIHAASRRASGPMITINCAALTETLLESELFGHEKGAFTGATERRLGRFEQADGGTLFLDEIGELSARCQAKLLRVLEARQVERLGSTVSIPVDVRVVAATHRDLAAMVRAGEFRQDLYFRLEVIVGAVPPLRERRDDLGMLAERFLRRFDAQLGRRPRTIGATGLAALRTHDWPGNVRELRNTVERLSVLCDADPIEAADVQGALGRSVSVANAPTAIKTLDQLEEEAVRAAYAATAGNKLRAAEMLGIDRTTLYKKLKRYGLA